MENDWMEEATIGLINNGRLNFLLRSAFLYDGVKVEVGKTKGFAWLAVQLTHDIPSGVQIRMAHRPIHYGISFHDFMKEVVSGLQYVLAERFCISEMVSGTAKF